MFEFGEEEFEFIVLRKSYFEVEGGRGLLKRWNGNSRGNKNHNLIPTIIFMELHYDRSHLVTITLSELIKFCNQEVDTHKGKSVDKMRELLKFLEDNKIISFRNNIDIMNKSQVGKDTFLWVKYNPIEFPKKDEDKTTFVDLFQKIPISSLKKLLNKGYSSDIITFWSFIETMKWNKNDLNENTIAPVLIRSYDQLKHSLCMSSDKIKEISDKLVEDGLLLYASDGTYKNGKEIRNYCNIYTTIDDDKLTIDDYRRFLNDGIKQHIHYMEERDGVKTLVKPIIVESCNINRIKSTYDKDYEKQQYNSLFEEIDEGEQEMTNKLYDLF